MTPPRIGRLPPGALVAAIASATMIAQQVAGKATRDALFLSSFSVKVLPAMMAGSAIISLFSVLWLSRMMLRHSPARVVPAGFGVSGVVLLAAWGLNFPAPRLAAVLLYLYTTLFGAAMISAFWSLINETFDAHSGRRSVAAITNGGTLGGLLGGLAAWRASALIAVPTMLPLLAALSFVSLWGSLRIKGSDERAAAPTDVADPGASPPSPMIILRESSYLRNLAMVVALCRFAASWDQPDGVFCRVMGPPLLQAEGTTRGGGVRSFSQPHGTSRFAGSWDPLR